ncbi:MAG TPA: hypothetical protein VEC38_15055 [Candidatus Binataceae bacterium]|nr:hypothetical protein [Candidatus Binataceae bacterium]
MIDRSARGARRGLPWAAPFLILAALAIAAAGCASHDDTSGVDDASDIGTIEPLTPPKATVAITYSQPGDALARATVSKFFGAEVLLSRAVRAGRTTSVVRFDGGVPIWEFKSDKSLAGRLSALTGGTYAIKQVEYGTVPPHFVQVIPDEGPPEPLDRGSYYVFTVERASGSTSYQAVKVLADGSLEAYAAQPRAGSSYLLCCNIAVDFPQPVVLPEPAVGEEPPEQNPNPGDSGSAQN